MQAQYKRLLDREMLRDPNEGVNYFKRFLRPHFIKGAQTVFLYRFMQFMKHNRGTMDLQRWMTRFQLNANRLTESWMDLIPDLDLTAADVIAAIAQRRTAHEEQQQNLVGIAQATPGAQPHVVVPWNDDMSRQVLVQLNNARRQQQRTLFPLSDNLSAFIFVSLADLTQDQRNTLTSIMTHCGRTLAQYNVQEIQRSIFGDVLRYTYSSWQSNDATLWHGTEKIFPRHGWRWDSWNHRLLGRRWRWWSRFLSRSSWRCFLGLWWHWIYMVSTKVPRKKNQTRQR